MLVVCAPRQHTFIVDCRSQLLQIEAIPDECCVLCIGIGLQWLWAWRCEASCTSKSIPPHTQFSNKFVKEHLGCILHHQALESGKRLPLGVVGILTLGALPTWHDCDFFWCS
eukprot:4453957-Amphidinium_carterae.1